MLSATIAPLKNQPPASPKPRSSNPNCGRLARLFENPARMVPVHQHALIPYVPLNFSFSITIEFPQLGVREEIVGPLSREPFHCRLTAV